MGLHIIPGHRTIYRRAYFVLLEKKNSFLLRNCLVNLQIGCSRLNENVVRGTTALSQGYTCRLFLARSYARALNVLSLLKCAILSYISRRDSHWSQFETLRFPTYRFTGLSNLILIETFL